MEATKVYVHEGTKFKKVSARDNFKCIRLMYINEKLNEFKMFQLPIQKIVKL